MAKKYALKDGTKLTETQIDTLVSLHKRGEQNIRWFHATAVKALRNNYMVAGYKTIRITDTGIAALRELGLIADAAAQPEAQDSGLLYDQPQPSELPAVPETKFQVGDKVRVIAGAYNGWEGNWLSADDNYTHDYDASSWVTIYDFQNIPVIRSFLNDHLERITPAQAEFKTGDQIIIIAGAWRDYRGEYIEPDRDYPHMSWVNVSEVGSDERELVSVSNDYLRRRVDDITPAQPTFKVGDEVTDGVEAFTVARVIRDQFGDTSYMVDVLGNDGERWQIDEDELGYYEHSDLWWSREWKEQGRQLYAQAQARIAQLEADKRALVEALNKLLLLTKEDVPAAVTDFIDDTLKTAKKGQ